MTKIKEIKIWIDLDNTPAVDSELEQKGRLTMVRSAEEVWTKIQFDPRIKNRPLNNGPKPARDDIVNSLGKVIRIERVGPHRRVDTSQN